MDIVDLMKAWLAVFAEGDFDAFPGSVSPDFTLHLPFTPPGVPTEMRGREVVREALRKTSAGRTPLVFSDVTIMRTEDPDLVMTRCNGKATMAGGKTYANSYIMLTRIRDGEVLEHTEYLNPLAVIAAFDDPG